MARKRNFKINVADTVLDANDHGGGGRPVVYLNGAYAGQGPWKPVLAELGAEFRHITYDQRARGRSQPSSDYSFEACLADLDAVIAASGAEKPLLVGWSYGATLGAHYAERHPDRVSGVVCVDGAMPYGLVGEEGREHIRRLFHKMRFVLPLVRPLGLAAKMSIEQHADVNIEINQISADMAPVLERLSVPTRYVLASNGNLGAAAEEIEAARASLEPVLAANPNLKVSAKVASNHSHLLRKDFKAVAAAVREVAALTS